MKYLIKTWSWLNGKKTFITALVLFCIGGAQVAGFITPETADLLYKLAGAVGLAVLRAGVAKLRK